MLSYNDKRYEYNDSGLIQLMYDIDLQHIKKIFELDESVNSIRHNNILDILKYSRVSSTDFTRLFKQVNVMTCDVCGNEHESMNTFSYCECAYGKQHICKECVEREGYVYCHGCHGYAKPSNFREVKVYDFRTNEVIETLKLCKNCCNDETEFGRVFKCRHCGEHYLFGMKNYSTNLISYGYVGEYNGYFALCGHCQEDYVYCTGCETVYLRTETQIIDGRCENCHVREKKRKALKGYNYKPEPDFKKEEDEPSTSKDYMGIELEVEIDSSFDVNTIDIAFDGTETNEDFLYAKTDGSLQNGVEFVSHPITFKAWKNTYLERLENDTLQKVRPYLIDRPSSAGIHIHLNRKALGTNEEKRKQVINRICYLLSKKQNYEYLTKFCRRDRSRIERWARPYYIDDYSDDMSRDIPIKDLVNTSGDRYHVVNLRNTNTIEFRCFASSTDIRDIQAYLVFVHNVVEFCKKNDDKIVRTTALQDIVTCYYKKFMTDYLKERGLI